MGTLTRYPSDPNLVFLGTNSTMGIMGQESGHRWLAFTPFRDGSVDSTDILGRDLAHWSFFFNSEGSVMEGNKIEDRGPALGNTRFLTVEATDTFSPLDEYIMGLIGPGTGSAVILGGESHRDVLAALKRAACWRYFRRRAARKSPSTASLPLTDLGVLLFTRRQRCSARDSFTWFHAGRQRHRNRSRRFRGYGMHGFDSSTSRPAGAAGLSRTCKTSRGLRLHRSFFRSFRETPIATPESPSQTGDRPLRTCSSPPTADDGNSRGSRYHIINPSMITIPPKAQVAMLAEQIHGLSLSDPRNGWIRADSTSSQVTGFFLDGDVSQTFLTGAVAGGSTNTSLYFTRAQVSSASSPGNTYRNLIEVVNPSSGWAYLTFVLHDEFGNARDSAIRGVGTQGRMAEDLPTLFPTITQPMSNGYVSVSSDQGVVGYQSIDSGSTIFSLPALPPSNATVLYSAHFAWGNADGIQYFSDLNFINTSGQSRKMQVLLIDNSGQPIGGIRNPVSVDLAAGQQMHVRGETIFGLPDASVATSYIDGSLMVTADGPGIIGDVAFGDAVSGRFLASLPLDGQPSSNIIFSQVAQGRAGNTKPCWTGIAMYNPGAADVSVTMDVYSKEGDKTGTASFPLSKGNRISRTLPQYVSSIQEQMGGYIRITTSGGPIVAFELFGGRMLEFLTAVPPQPIVP